MIMIVGAPLNEQCANLSGRASNILLCVGADRIRIVIAICIQFDVNKYDAQ